MPASSSRRSRRFDWRRRRLAGFTVPNRHEKPRTPRLLSGSSHEKAASVPPAPSDAGAAACALITCVLTNCRRRRWGHTWTLAGFTSSETCEPWSWTPGSARSRSSLRRRRMAGLGPISFSNRSRVAAQFVSDIDAFGCLRSLRAHGHLMGLARHGAAWLKPQSADGSAACDRIGAVIHSLPRASLPLGSCFGLLCDPVPRSATPA